MRKILLFVFVVFEMVAFSFCAEAQTLANEQMRETSNSSFSSPEYFNKLFYISIEDAKDLINNFHAEMKEGLSGDKSSLKMAPSFIDKPKYSERGKFIAIDLGGTNFRILEIELDGKGGLHVLATDKYVIKKEVMQGSGEQLFDFIAISTKSFMEKYGISFENPIFLGFTFSFPIKLNSRSSGILISWAKGFTASGVVGRDVVECLNQALLRQRMNNVKVVALVADAVSALVAENYIDHSCDMSVILGTGTDASYIETASKIEKLHDADYNDKNMIINLGWGSFDKFSRNKYDEHVDRISLNQNQQKVEKLISGMYLGEVLRLVVCDLIQKGILFKQDDIKIFDKQNILSAEHMATSIEGDESMDLKKVGDYLVGLGIKDPDLNSKKCFRDLCKIISLRSARLAATLVAAVITWIDPELKNSHTIGVDGSLFEKYPHYEDNMKQALSELFGEKASRIKFELIKDGSGKGASIAAAMAVYAGEKTDL